MATVAVLVGLATVGLRGVAVQTWDDTDGSDVVDEGFTDAAAATGEGLTATWPARGSRLPGIAIDHVLFARNVGVSEVRVVHVDGTDHRAVWARLILPLRT